MDERKTHTGEHILFRALSTVFEGMTVKKVEFGKRNYFLVHYDKEFDWKGILEAEKIANRTVREGRPVTRVQCTRKEAAEQFPQLRVRWDRIKEDTVTVVEVEGYDWAACVGDHVANTEEIEYILVTRITSVGKGDYEIEFEVGEKAKGEALNRSALAMEVSSVLKTSLDKVIPTVKNLKEAQRALTESVRLLTKNVVKKITPEDITGISVYLEDVSGADLNLLQKTAAQLTCSGKTLVVFIEHVNNMVVMARSPSVPFDCRELLRTVLPEGRGGGNPGYVMASSPQEIDIKEMKARIRQFLEEREQPPER